MKAAQLTRYGRMVWTDVPDPPCGEGQVRVRVDYAGICGSDLHVFQGEFHPRTPVPFIPGHEFAGTVAELGPGVTGLTPGRTVVVDPIVWCGDCPACARGHYPACTRLRLVGIDFDGGFAEQVVVGAAQVYPVPPGITPRHAALVEVLAIGFHACRRAGVQAGDCLAVWGAGRVGQCIVQAARTITEAPILLVDVDEARLQRAAEAYANVIPVPALSGDPVAAISAHTGGAGVDIAFEAVGHARDLDRCVEPVVGCIEALRAGGTVCVLGLSDHPVGIVFKRLIWKEGRLVTSRVSHGEFADVLEALAAGRLQPEALISASVPAARAQEAFEGLLREPAAHLKILLDLRSEA